MALDPGTRLGPYEIVAPLGSGGMGEVYRARDTRLDRDVAVKILPPDVAHDSTRLSRFAHEARAAAALNHPNILGVHDVSVDSESPYLVAELLEGSTLYDRLHQAPGGLSPRRAIEIAQQVAQGLAAAHAKGIIHRDLKPANLFITTDGRVKILDFGLAKTIETVAGPQQLAASSGQASVETRSVSASDTSPGRIIGTVAYMAPEQVRGHQVDARTDLFAVGVVLYEMLSGRRPFEAGTAADTMSAILGKDPVDLTSSHSQPIPPAIHRLVSRCLEKDPVARFQSAADLAFALQSLTTDSVASAAWRDFSASTMPARPMRLREMAWAATAIAALAGCAALWWMRPQPAVPALSAQFDVTLPEAAGFGRMNLSPDGQWLIVSTQGEPLLLRSQADGTIQRIPTAARRGVFSWTPDSSSFLFVTALGIQVFRLADRTISVLAPAPDGVGLWTGAASATELVMADAHGNIWVKATRDAEPRKVMAGSGTPRLIVGIHAPSRRFVYLQPRESGEPGLFTASLDGAVPARIDAQPWEAATLVNDGLLLLGKETLYFQRLSADGNRFDGPPLIFSRGGDTGRFSWAASNSGVLVIRSHGDFRFRWYSRTGTAAANWVGTAGPWAMFDLSNDGRRLVASRAADDSPNIRNLWSIDLERAVQDRLTFGSTRDLDVAWHGDGRQVMFAGSPDNNPPTTAFRVRPGKAPEAVYEDPNGFVLDDWSADGKWILFHRRTQSADGILWAVQAEPPQSPREAAGCQRGVADQGRFSPDGRWLAFNCNESGRFEIYVVPFQHNGDRVRVSVEGGMQPNWRLDGRELFFLGPDGAMMASGLTSTTDELTAAAPQRLFETGLVPTYQGEQYAVAPDGQRFLLREAGSGASTLHFILNWPARLQRESPSK